MKTAATAKKELMVSAQLEMKKTIQDIDLSDRQKLALTAGFYLTKAMMRELQGKLRVVLPSQIPI